MRLFDVQTPIRYLENVEGLSPEEEAPAQHVLAVLKELQSIQDEVVERVKRDVPMVFPIAQTSTNEVAWLGGAAQLLARLGLPHRLVADIQAKENQQKNLSSSAFDAVIEPDGSLVIEGSTDRVVSVRTSSSRAFRRES